MKIKSALLVALLGAVSIPQSTLAVETPPGWHRTTDDTGITLTAIDDDNREVKLDISPLLSNDDNKSAAEYVQEFMDSSENSTEMQVTHRGEIQKKRETCCHYLPGKVRRNSGHHHLRDLSGQEKCLALHFCYHERRCKRTETSPKNG